MMRIKIFGVLVCVYLSMAVREIDGVIARANALENPNVICHHAHLMNGIIKTDNHLDFVFLIQIVEVIDTVIGQTNVQVFPIVHTIHLWKYHRTKQLVSHKFLFSRHTCQSLNKMRSAVAVIIGTSLEQALPIILTVLLNVTKVSVPQNPVLA